MARAKRTDRTEARRRHRAELAALAETEPGTETRTASSSQQTSGQTPPPAKPSIMASFRLAYRPLRLRDDLKSLPLVVTNWGFLAAMGATAAIGAWFVLSYNDGMAAIPVGQATQAQLEQVVGANSIPYFLGTMALQPPPAIGAFLIGFTAKRASWLGGLIYGIFVTALAIVVLQTQAGRLLTGDQPMDALVVGHAAWSPLGAALFAAAAAWYRRFLDLANPNRRQRSGKPQGRSNAKAKPAR